ncbi:MAG: glycosyltransferase [Sedimentitalea sp.]|nr:glycosyltransferase [Sedimentitalea sp.]
MTGARPLASVIIPSHNRRALLIEAMDSVRAQSYRPLELIVVDDGSTDGTAEAVAAWIEAQKDAPDFQALLLVQPNAGAPAARNWGFAAARGAYIQYLDSDDLLGPEKIATAARILARDPEVDMVCAGMEILDTATGARRRFEGADLAARPTPAEIALRMSQTMIPVFRRAVIHAAGPWDEHLAALQDWEFFARALLHVRRAAAVPGVHCVMRQHPGARVSTRRDRRAELEASRVRAVRSVLDAIRQSGARDPAAEARMLRWYAAAVLAVARLGGGAEARALLAEDADRWPDWMRFRLLRRALLGVCRLPGPSLDRLVLNARRWRSRA